MMVTLTGTFTRLDGTPATGTVRVTPSRSPIMDPDGQVVISGPQVFPLDKDGKLATEIPASNDPDLGPAFTYAVDVNLTHASWKISKVWIPHGSTTVDLSEIGDYQPVPGVATRVVTIPADGTDGQVLVWDGAGFSWADVPEGPQGPPGEVTTADLTTALAGKVTGTGMTLRRDTSVGTRVLLDHPGGSTMLYGDTGWRDITSICTGIEYGNIHIRRTTADVQWRFESVVLTPGTATLQIASNIPTGWRPTERAVISTATHRSSLVHRQNFAVQSANLFWLSETTISNAGTTSTARPETPISGIIATPATGWPTALIGTP